MDDRPNILLIMTDEERYPPCYETDAIAGYRQTQLPGQMTLRARSTEFHRHYAASVACVPSRASLFTGHYPTLHGVRATDGAAKAARDPDVFWLEPNTVPTMGHYFRAGGYRTMYRGKWHVSHDDLVVPDTHTSLATNDTDGATISNNTALYGAADRLSQHGFSGWIGPDPHGAAQSNSGIVRDPLIGDQVSAMFDSLEASDDTSPWLAVASFVNPHDIVLFGALWRSWGYDLDDDTVPDIPESPSEEESLDTKPQCQADFVDKYRKVFIAQPQTGTYRRFYYYLHKLVDTQVRRLLNRLAASRFGANTIVIYTSDHGEMLGAHGGMHQKWHNAYDESWRVPLLIAGPDIPPGHQITQPSSHVDLLPTMLGLAGIDAASLLDELTETHSEAQPLPGRDLSGLVRGEPLDDEPIYLMTEDEVSEGLDQTSIAGTDYEAVTEPAKLEAVITQLDDGGPLWKLARYYEDSLIGTDTAGPDRWPRQNQEFELYDLTGDPTEAVNLAHRSNQNRSTKAVQDRLEDALERTRETKAATPRNRQTP